jgi:Cytochrome C oxidase, cbb3-type, subunit III
VREVRGSSRCGRSHGLVRAIGCAAAAQGRQSRRGENKKSRRRNRRIDGGRPAHVRALCVRCHGPEGKGDGEAAAGATPSDLTGTQWTHGSTDGELFSVIHDGTSADMAGYAERMSDTDIWNVVNYIRTFKR